VYHLQQKQCLVRGASGGLFIVFTETNLLIPTGILAFLLLVTPFSTFASVVVVYASLVVESYLLTRSLACVISCSASLSVSWLLRWLFAIFAGHLSSIHKGNTVRKISHPLSFGFASRFKLCQVLLNCDIVRMIDR